MVQAAASEMADRHVGPDAEPAQVVRELVGARIQLAVGQRLALEHHRDRIRVAVGLGLEQLVQALVAREIDRGVVPLLDDLVTLRSGQERQVRGLALGILQQPASSVAR